MARSWREIRAEANLDEARVAEHQGRLLAETRAYRLAEIRKSQGLTQVEVAKALHVGQSQVSKIERGDVQTTGLATLGSYVGALGGRIEVVAIFGDERHVIG